MFFLVFFVKIPKKLIATLASSEVFSVSAVNRPAYNGGFSQGPQREKSRSTALHYQPRN
jgi:hypothetical protein